VYRALIVLAALVGFGVGFVVTFIIGMEETSAPECDGVCFERLDEVLWVSGGIAVVTAIVFGVVARYVRRRRRAAPKGRP
jgi:putative flippase GtrA